MPIFSDIPSYYHLEQQLLEQNTALLLYYPYLRKCRIAPSSPDKTADPPLEISGRM